MTESGNSLVANQRLITKVYFPRLVIPVSAVLAGLVDFVRGLQGELGLWTCEAQPQASRWLTFDLLRSLSRLDETGEWLSQEPRTPFQTYSRKRPRY